MRRIGAIGALIVVIAVGAYAEASTGIATSSQLLIPVGGKATGDYSGRNAVIVK